MPCPVCRLPIPAPVFERHLRQTHQLYTYRGLARPWSETLGALLAALVTPRPDWEAWRLLLEISTELHGPKAEVFVASALGSALSRLEDQPRAVVVEGLSRLLGFKERVPLVGALASDSEPAARHLALMGIGRLPLPLDTSLLPPLRGLLLDRRLPVDAHFKALANVLRGIPTDSPLAAELVGKLVSGLGKSRSIERLREFEQRNGGHPAIDQLVNQLEDQLRMNCPRCGVQLRRPQMIEHLWSEHRLVLEGRRVKEPWSLIEEWLDDVGPRADSDLLERCRELAQRVDPENGLHRVQRMFLARGLNDPEARRTVLEDARAGHASICPWCYAQVPVPIELPPYVVINRGGRIAGNGYVVEVSDQNVRTLLEIRTPGKLLSSDREPGRLLTLRGARSLMVGPIVVLTVWVAFAMPGATELVPLGFVISTLGIALVLEIFVRMFWTQTVPAADRALQYAWQLLAPRLHADGFKLEDSAFAAGLAQITPPGHSSLVRVPLLLRLTKVTEEAVQKRIAPPDHLAALRRLMIADAASVGDDPIPLVVEQLAQCFEGKVPMVYAERLLADWEADWWSKENLARLRILLCDRAYEAGFEVQNLLDAGHSAPALAEVIKTEEVPGLASLRLLWSFRATQPWDRNGSVNTAFEVAADATRTRLLGEYPDLLLWQEEIAWQIVADGAQKQATPCEICLSDRGVALQDVLYAQTPAKVEVSTTADGFDLILGEHRFRSSDDLDGLARRMERWFRYWFNEFMPMTKNVINWKAPDRAARMRTWGATPCPECGKPVLARVGAVGLRVDEAAS